MPDLTRRRFLIATAAVGGLRAVPMLATKPQARRVVTLVYDKALGAMRLIDKAVP